MSQSDKHPVDRTPTGSQPPLSYEEIPHVICYDRGWKTADNAGTAGPYFLLHYGMMPEGMRELATLQGMIGKSARLEMWPMLFKEVPGDRATSFFARFTKGELTTSLNHDYHMSIRFLTYELPCRCRLVELSLTP